MLCLIKLSSAPRRDTVLPASRSHDDERQRQAFHQWFPRSPLNDSPAPRLPAPSACADLALALELAPYQMHLENLGQFTHNSLSLRLTNGPLAGLEICASAHASTLHLQVRTPDRARFEQIAGSRSALENELARLFNRPIILEVFDAAATTE